MKLQDLHDNLQSAPASMPITVVIRIGNDRSWWLPITETEFQAGKFVITSVANFEKTTTTVECMLNSIQSYLKYNPEVFVSWKISKGDTHIITTMGDAPVVSCQISPDKLKFWIKASD